jgi:hypothetical protein
MLGQDLFWSISALVDPNANPNFNLTLTLTLLFSYPHGYEMKGYGSSALIITSIRILQYLTSGVRRSRFYPLFFAILKDRLSKTFLCPNLKRYYS